MRQFIKELEAEADFVIIDTPPSGLLSDAAIVAQYVDGAVFVIRQDYTDVYYKYLYSKTYTLCRGLNSVLFV